LEGELKEDLYIHVFNKDILFQRIKINTCTLISGFSIGSMRIIASAIGQAAIKTIREWDNQRKTRIEEVFQQQPITFWEDVFILGGILLTAFSLVILRKIWNADAEQMKRNIQQFNSKAS